MLHFMCMTTNASVVYQLTSFYINSYICSPSPSFFFFFLLLFRLNQIIPPQWSSIGIESSNLHWIKSRSLFYTLNGIQKMKLHSKHRRCLHAIRIPSLLWWNHLYLIKINSNIPVINSLSPRKEYKRVDLSIGIYLLWCGGISQVQ